MDGIGNGLGYSLLLILVAAIRELFGAGRLLGIQVLPLVTEGGWYQPLNLLLLSPSAFFIIGLLIWVSRSWKTQQVEKPEYTLAAHSRPGPPCWRADDGALPGLFIRSIFIENMALSFFLGMCTFLAISRNIQAAIGLGIAVVAVLALTTPLNNLLYHYCWPRVRWTGRSAGCGPEFSRLSLLYRCHRSQCADTGNALDRYVPVLYNALGVFLPLITVNCAILGASLLMVERDLSLAESTVFGTGAGVGWALAITALAGIREKMKYSDVPEGLRGLGITFITVGLMALGFMSFGGILL